jgi:hypothetical protein
MDPYSTLIGFIISQSLIQFLPNKYVYKPILLTRIYVVIYDKLNSAMYSFPVLHK